MRFKPWMRAGGRGTVAAALALSASLSLSGCGKKGDRAASTGADTTAAGGAVTPAPPTPAPAAALRVSDIALGKHVGTDKHVSDQTTTFAPRDTVYVSIITEGAAPSAKLAARWTYGAGQLVKESSQTIAPTGGTSATEFHIQKPSGWPKGQYQVVVLLDGQNVGSKSFQVK